MKGFYGLVAGIQTVNEFYFFINLDEQEESQKKTVIVRRQILSQLTLNFRDSRSSKLSIGMLVLEEALTPPLKRNRK